MSFDIRDMSIQQINNFVVEKFAAKVVEMRQPTPRPTRIIDLGANATPEDVERFRQDWLRREDDDWPPQRLDTGTDVL